MSTEALISAISPVATGAVVGLLLWGWRKFIGRLDANRDQTLEAVSNLDKKVETLSTNQSLHQEADQALFAMHDKRISKSEGSIEVLIQILAAKEQK